MDKGDVLKVDRGYVRLFKPDGSFVRHICGNAAHAELKGREIYVTMHDGEIRVFSIKGFYIKTLENS